MSMMPYPWPFQDQLTIKHVRDALAGTFYPAERSRLNLPDPERATYTPGDDDA